MVAAAVVTTAARLVMSPRIAAASEGSVTLVVILVTWLGIAFRNQAAAVNVEDVEMGATLAVTLVTWLGIVLRSLVVSV